MLLLGIFMICIIVYGVFIIVELRKETKKRIETMDVILEYFKTETEYKKNLYN